MSPRVPERRISTTTFTVVSLAIALLIAGGLSLLASAHPDGLEFVAESMGFGSAAQDSAVAGSPLADYAVAGIDQPWLAVGVAALCGCALTFGIAWLIGRMVARRDRS